MNKAFMPGIVPDESRRADMRLLLERDRALLQAKIDLGEIDEAEGIVIVAYIDKYLHYI